MTSCEIDDNREAEFMRSGEKDNKGKVKVYLTTTAYKLSGRAGGRAAGNKQRLVTQLWTLTCRK
ncbi:hypothetical protein K440DRAFT_52610 [Wilcoxina mikolae CBS 423.85]|nr:hypothetical protein K440DRAFT_52610 [Wilcoxina mikolae CBS 423.85]